MKCSGLQARITHEHLLRRPILSRGAHCSACCNGPWTFRRTDDPLHLGEQQVPRFGLDRLATAFTNNPGLICGLEHVRETIPFPRLLYKIYP